MAVGQSIWGRVLGHEALLHRLDQEITNGRPAQAYLFAGPAGVGKTLVARGLAQRLNCTGEPKPCGECAACRAVANDVPTWLQVLEPEEQAGNAAVHVRVHKIETIRRLQAESNLVALGTQTRVCILRSAELMNEASANCLLKTLEEPPPRLCLVLTAEQPAGLLPTVLSRVRRYDFGVVPAARIEGWLREVHGVDAETARVAARVAAGRPGRALALATDPATRERRNEVLALVQQVGRQPAAAALRASQLLLGGEEAGGDRLELALDLLEWWYRDALVLRTAGGAAEVVNDDRRRELTGFAERWSAAELRRCLGALQQARMSLRRNGNAPLVLDVLWLRMARGGRAAGA